MVTYHYCIDKRARGFASKSVASDLSEGCLYEFEDKWSRCWNPILPYSEQIDPIKLEVLCYEPDQSCPFQTPSGVYSELLTPDPSASTPNESRNPVEPDNLDISNIVPPSPSDSDLDSFLRANLGRTQEEERIASSEATSHQSTLVNSPQQNSTRQSLSQSDLPPTQFQAQALTQLPSELDASKSDTLVTQAATQPLPSAKNMTLAKPSPCAATQPTGGAEFSCPKCGKKYKRRSFFDKHVTKCSK